MGYYDPDLKVGRPDHGRANVSNWVPTLWPGITMDEGLFRPLYDTMIRAHYRPQGDGTGHLAATGGTDIDVSIVTGLGAALARAIGDTDTADAMARWIEAKYQPLRDCERGEFAYGFGFNETWPRGQYNAWVMPSHLVTHPGHWRGTFQRPNVAKFAQPTVEGIDFPSVRVRVACYDAARKRLDVELAAGIPDAVGRPMEFRVTRLSRGARYTVVANDAPGVEQPATDGTIAIRTTVGPQRFSVHLNG